MKASRRVDAPPAAAQDPSARLRAVGTTASRSGDGAVEGQRGPRQGFRIRTLGAASPDLARSGSGYKKA